jgi:hypothetical protein
MVIKPFIKFWILGLTLTLIGCTTTNKPNSTMKIGNIDYPLNDQGKVILTQNDINQLQQQQGQAIYINNILPSGAIIMTAQEMELLTSNPDALNQFVNKISPAKPQYQNAMIQQGNIRLNIEKYARENQWHINYVAKEYLIEKPYLINAPDFESLILEILAEFPVFVTFNTEKKIVFIQQQQKQPQPNITQIKPVPLKPAIKEEINDHFTKTMPSGQVSFKLTPGSLKPQIIELLTNHQLINHKKNIKWLANTSYQWSSEFEAQAPSLDELLQQLLQPYNLRVDFKANNIALITNQKRPNDNE